jgi:hypothetical protein
MTMPVTIRMPRRGIDDRIAVSPASVSALLKSPDSYRFPSSRDQLLQALLHLPRLANIDGRMDVETARAELDRLEAGRLDEVKPYARLAAAPSSIPSLNELDVRVIAGDDAEPIASHFHYLRSFRRDSLCVAAVAESRIVALCMISPFDLPHIARKLAVEPYEDVAVVSRVFAFDWAPRNTISFMLARAEKVASARLLLTYLNPNMGFTGASVRAANWEPAGFETGTRYAYLAASYITDRRLANLAPKELRAAEFSRMRLLPLEVYRRVLDRKLIGRDAHLGSFVVARPRLAGGV